MSKQVGALFIASILTVPFSGGWKVGPITVSPFAILVLLTSIPIGKKSYLKLAWSDLCLFLFFLWGVISFIFINNSPEVLRGVFGLGIYLLFYFNVKNYICDRKLRKTFVLSLISLIFFESLLALWQFIFGRPLGLPFERIIKNNPYGWLADDGTGFRVTGTMKGPNSLSSFLTILLPFIFLLNRLTIVKILLLFFALAAILVSFTRFSWLMAILVMVILFLFKKPKTSFSFGRIKVYLPLLLVFILMSFILFPYFIDKISLTGLAFSPFGPLDTRFKLNQEAINLIIQYPFFGVGLSRFSDFATAGNITGIFYSFPNLIVHNVPLLIAVEMGIPALGLFICFIFFSYRRYFFFRKKLDLNSRDFKDIAALSGLIYLLEANMVTLFPAPHFALFLAFLAIISL